MKKLIATCLLLASVAKAQDDESGRLYPFLEIGAARSLPATLADRRATAMTSTAAGTQTQWREATRLRLDGQWGLIAEGRVPLDEQKHWAIDAFVARFRGSARAIAAVQHAIVNGGAIGGNGTDSLDYRMHGVTSWRGTLSAARAVPISSHLTGALLVGGTWGTVRSPDAACSASSCPPVLHLSTPGVTLGAEVFTVPWRGLRFRLGGKGDVLSIDEAEVRRNFRSSFLTTAPTGEGARRWHLFPQITGGVEFRIPL